MIAVWFSPNSMSPCRRAVALSLVFALAVAALGQTAASARADDQLVPGQLIQTAPPRPVPELTLTNLADEQPASLATYRGKPLIVNLWATWCGPCVKEMPSLAKLSTEMKEIGLTVVAISEDRGGKFVVDPFLKEHEISGLPIYLDKTMSSGKAFKATTILPMTILIDADGNEIGRVMGDRDWDSAESKAELVKAFGLKAG